MRSAIMTQTSKTSQADARSKPHDAPPRHTENTSGLSEGDTATRPSNAEKDPDQWTTGDESMTSYLQTLSEEAGEPFEPNLSKAEASKRIDALQARTGRGRDH
jgi:hypothetical protein